VAGERKAEAASDEAEVRRAALGAGGGWGGSAGGREGGRRRAPALLGSGFSARCGHPGDTARPLPLPQESRGKPRWVERSYGRFMRAFTLPAEGVDADGISCAMKDGVMTLTVPKVPAPPKPAVKEIPVDA
jgi:hypothetical protein